MRMARLLAPALLAAVLMLPAAAADAATSKRRPVAAPQRPVLTAPSLVVGSLTLAACQGRRAYCGSLARPLDPSGEVPGSIDIAVEFYPRSNNALPRAGTIVASEGGPGYSTTGSRASYLGLFEPLLDDHDLLLVDNRGTGKSTPVDCPELQSTYPLTQEAIVACGQQLGNSSDLYGTGLAADDLAAVIDAMQLGPVDLYGDSYGTYFGQAFAGRHPDKLRSLTLDGAYQITGLSPWYPENADTVRGAFNQVCERSAACQHLEGESLARIDAMVRSLRTAPVSGTAADGNGNPLAVTADPTAVAFLMNTAGYSRAIYRELDAAARAYTGTGDAAPLLRMVAESRGDYTPPLIDQQTQWLSTGLFVAVSCSDYPQIYDMTKPPSKRQEQRDEAVANMQSQNPDLYAPFTIGEFAGMPLDYSLLDLCLNWPIPSAAFPPGKPVPPDVAFTTAPVLVMSGELDTVTSPPQGLAAAEQFANAQQVVVKNSFHVTALGDLDNCASRLVVDFVSTLSPGNIDCAQQIPEVRLVPAFASTYAALSPATAGSGNKATADALRAATAAVLTAGDAMGRWWVNYDGSGVGLRGGSFSWSATGSGYQFTLNAMKFTSDVSVSGTISWNYGSGAVTAALTTSGSGVPAGTITAKWNDLQPAAVAAITGKLGGRKVVASMPAP